METCEILKTYGQTGGQTESCNFHIHPRESQGQQHTGTQHARLALSLDVFQLTPLAVTKVNMRSIPIFLKKFCDFNGKIMNDEDDDEIRR